MKILLATGIYPPDIGGPASFTRGLALALQRRGHQVTVLCYGDETTERTNGIPVSVISRTGGAILRYFRYTWRAFWLARSVDLIFAQGPVSEGFPATLVVRLLKKPLVMKVVGDVAWEIANQVPGVELLDVFVLNQHQGKIGMLEKIERWTTKQARTVFVPSQYLQGIVTKWGVNPERIHVIYNTSPILPATPISNDVWREQHQLTGKKILLFVGRLVSWKRIDFLLSVMQGLDESCALVVVGDGPMLTEWQALAIKLDLNKRVLFVGRADRVQTAQWFFAADVFLLSSTYEGLSHVLLEALSTGLPCVVSDAGGNPEIKQIAPELVQVLSLENIEAWRQAIYSLLGKRGSSRQWQTAEQMYKAYLQRLMQVISA